MNSKPESLGQRLKSLRGSRKMSQYELADASGVSRATIANIERDVYQTTQLETLLKLADALGVTVSNLVEGIETHSTHPKDLVAEFLDSALGQAASVTPEEEAWLRSLPEISWLGDAPSEKTFFHMLLGLRERMKAG